MHSRRILRAPLGLGLGLGVGLGGGGAMALASVPAVFFAGQSNNGNTDTGVSGWTADARVTLTWVADDTTVNGPALPAVQSANGNPGGGPGHAYELSCGSDLAAHYNANIITAKAWQDGVNADAFNRQNTANTGWSFTLRALIAFGTQCRTAGVTAACIVYDQGSNECLTVNSAVTPLWLARTQSTIASMRAILRAFGINRVHILMMQQVSSFASASGIDAGQLATIRAAAQTFVDNDSDASLFNCDDILLQGGGFHWVGGQSLTIGSRMATQIASKFTSAVAAGTPLTRADIFGANLVGNFVPRDLALSDGAAVTTLVSRFGASPTLSGTATYKKNLLGNLDGLQHNGTSDKMTLSVSLAAPGTTRFFMSAIMRQDTWGTAGTRLIGAAAATPSLATVTASPQIQPSNGTPGTALSKLTVGAFQRVEWHMRNSSVNYIGGAANDLSGASAGDYLRIGSGTGAVSNGTNLGNAAIGALQIGGGNSTFDQISWLEILLLNTTPTKDQGDKDLGYVVATYGSTIGP